MPLFVGGQEDRSSQRRQGGSSEGGAQGMCVLRKKRGASGASRGTTCHREGQVDISCCYALLWNKDE